MNATEKTMEKIVALCKGRGFVFAGSEIYGGLSNTWDYGPLGVELKNNVKRAWWKRFVQQNPYNVGLDSAILDPTNRDMMGVIYATEALLGLDDYCMEYIGAYRDGLFGPVKQ